MEQAKSNGRAKASGLVNAVLRQVSRNKSHLPPIPDRDETQNLSIRYSHPKWLVKRLIALLGREEAEALLAADNAPAPLTIQVNPLKTTGEALTAARSFKVESKRADKTFPMNSIQLSQAVGGDLAELFPNVAVDVHSPDLTVFVEIREKYAYVHAPSVPVPAGCPSAVAAGR